MSKIKNITARFDPTIYMFFVAVIILGLAVLLYQWNRKIDCEGAVFYVNSDDYAVGSVVEFGDKTNNAKSWKWDFGDGTTDDRQVTLHKYSKPGDYIVKLLINGSCYHEKLVSIGNYDVNPEFLPFIYSEDVASVGDVVYFEGEKSGGKTYEWSFGESGDLDALGKRVKTVYTSPGVKYVSLIVNGDRKHIASKEIYIAPRSLRTKEKFVPEDYFPQSISMIKEEVYTPPETSIDPLVKKIESIPSEPTHKIKEKKKKDGAIKCKNVSTDFLKRQIYLVSSQSLTVDDIEEYTCDGRSTKVVTLGKNNDIITLEKLCSQLSNQKIDINSFSVEKDENNCVKIIRIDYKIKKPLLGLKK